MDSPTSAYRARRLSAVSRRMSWSLLFHLPLLHPQEQGETFVFCCLLSSVCLSAKHTFLLCVSLIRFQLIISSALTRGLESEAGHLIVLIWNARSFSFLTCEFLVPSPHQDVDDPVISLPLLWRPGELLDVVITIQLPLCLARGRYLREVCAHTGQVRVGSTLSHACLFQEARAMTTSSPLYKLSCFRSDSICLVIRTCTRSTWDVQKRF